MVSTDGVWLNGLQWPLATESGEILWTYPELYHYTWVLLTLGDEDEVKALPPGGARLEGELS